MPKTITVADIAAHLENIRPLIADNMAVIIARGIVGLSKDTDHIDFLIRNDGFMYNVVWYAMDNDDDQTGGGDRLLPQMEKTGIIIPPEFVPKRKDPDYDEVYDDLEDFCEEHTQEIVDLIAACLSDAWLAQTKKSKYNAFAVFIDDEDRMFDLQEKKWMD